MKSAAVRRNFRFDGYRHNFGPHAWITERAALEKAGFLPSFLQPQQREWPAVGGDAAESLRRRRPRVAFHDFPAASSPPVSHGVTKALLTTAVRDCGHQVSAHEISDAVKNSAAASADLRSLACD